MRLHQVPQIKGLRMWCGPTSISAVTGILYADVCDAIRLYRGQTIGKAEPDIGSMCDHELVGTLGYLGYAVQTFEPSWGNGLLSKYIHTLDPSWDGVEILSTRSHFTAISYTEMVDTKTFGEIVPLWAAPRMSCVVEHALAVKRMPLCRAYRLT